MTMPADPVLSARALVELVARVGSKPLSEYASLAGAECEHQYVALFLADMAVSVATAPEFDLQALIDRTRAKALATDEPPGGMA